MISTFSKILTRTILSFGVLTVVVALVLVAALARGPLSLTFMGPYLDQVIAEQYPDYKFAFDDIEMLWDGRDKNLVFNLDNMSVRKERETVAFIPSVTVTFSGSALTKGRIAPSGLEFSGLKIVLTRDEAGSVSLGYSYANEPTTESGNGPLSQEGADPEFIHALLAELGQKESTSDLTAYLERLEIYQFGLFVEDRKMDKMWRITSADMVVWKSEQGLSGRLQGDAHFGDDAINLVFDAAYDRSSRVTVVQTSIRDLPLPLLAREIPDLEILQGVTLPVSGLIDLSLDPQFQPAQVRFDLKAGAGQVDIPSLYKKPLTINQIDVQGHSAAPFDGVNLNLLKIDSPGPKITMTGAFQQTEAGFGMSIEGSFPEIKTKDVAVYWPYSAAVDAYKWVTGKISEGQANNVTFRVDLPPGALETGKIPDDAIELKFDIQGASADYFSPLPKVTNISGKTILTEKQIHIYDMVGEVQGVKLPKGDVLIYDFDKYDQIADIKLTVAGDNQKIFEFIDRKPLGFSTTYGVIPDQMKGVGSVEARFIFPLRDDLTLEKLDFDVRGAFQGAYIPNVYEHLNLSSADMTVLVTPDKMTVKGDGVLNGTNADIVFQSWFKGARAGDRRYEVVAKLDEPARKELKLLDTEYLSGSVGASLAVDLKNDKTSAGVVTLNLLESEIDLPVLKINKPVGVRGLVGAQFATTKEGLTQLSNIRLSAENLELVAKATIDDAGLLDFTADTFRFGSSTMVVSVKRRSPDSYDVRLNGDQVDFRPYILSDDGADGSVPAPEKLTPVDPETVGPDVTIAFAFDNGLLDEGLMLSNLSGAIKFGTGIVQEAEVTGLLAGQHPVKYTVQPEGPLGRKVSFWTEDAGMLLKAMDIYDNGQGGKLQLSAKMSNNPNEENLKGQLKIEELKVYKAPVLGKILTIGSLTGIVELLQGDGMTFASIEGPFSYKDGVIETKDFRAVGAIGLTFTGKIDQNLGQTEGFGTVIPAYTLNSILGNIPILGRLLVGREGEGIFGFSYKLSGKSEDPDVFVNPVSALAPGILRRMFFEPWGDADTQPPTPDTKKGPSAQP